MKLVTWNVNGLVWLWLNFQPGTSGPKHKPHKRCLYHAAVVVTCCSSSPDESANHRAGGSCSSMA
jgi:hypothetical protein